MLAQQPAYDSACGVYAIAFAFSYILGGKLQEENYSARDMRTHLRFCVANKYVMPFPTRNSFLMSSSTEENSVTNGRNARGNSKKKTHTH